MMVTERYLGATLDNKIIFKVRVLEMPGEASTGVGCNDVRRIVESVMLQKVEAWTRALGVGRRCRKVDGQIYAPVDSSKNSSVNPYITRKMIQGKKQ